MRGRRLSVRLRKNGDDAIGLDKFGFNLLGFSLSGPILTRKDSAGNKKENGVTATPFATAN